MTNVTKSTIPTSEASEQPVPVPVTGAKTAIPQPPGEIGGVTGPEPTRYGDWERNGRCSDF